MLPAKLRLFILRGCLAGGVCQGQHGAARVGLQTLGLGTQAKRAFRFLQRGLKTWRCFCGIHFWVGAVVLVARKLTGDRRSSPAKHPFAAERRLMSTNSIP